MLLLLVSARGAARGHRAGPRAQRGWSSSHSFWSGLYAALSMHLSSRSASMKRALVSSVAGVGAFAAAVTVTALLPGSRLVGAVNPAVNQGDIAVTICTPGWTATVRPPSSYTHPIKVRLWQQAGSHGQVGEYELDHIVPLAVGGAPKDLRNLQLQPWDGPDGAHAKDVVEVRVQREVCAGKISLAAGQRCFRIDWRKCD